MATIDRCAPYAAASGLVANDLGNRQGFSRRDWPPRDCSCHTNSTNSKPSQCRKVSSRVLIPNNLQKLFPIFSVEGASGAASATVNITVDNNDNEVETQSRMPKHSPKKNPPPNSDGGIYWIENGQEDRGQFPSQKSSKENGEFIFISRKGKISQN